IAGPEVLAAPVGTSPGSRPARMGEILEIFGTGLGSVSRTQSNGTPKPTTTPPAISQTPIVTVGGVPASVTFSGLAPGLVGVYQVNVQVPGGVAAGAAVLVVASMGGVTSNAVTVALQ